MKRIVSLLLALTLALCLLTVSAFAANGTVGEYYDEIEASVDEGQYIESFNASGSLPAGLEFGLNNSHTQIRLFGTPTAAGSATVTLDYTVVTEETGESESNSVSVSVSVQDAAPTPDPAKAPKITKSPTSETRPEGGDTLFIAKADDYSSCYWQFISPDGSDMSVGEFKAKFPNVYISGESTTTLAISGFEKGMTGYKVICVFDNAGGRSVTDAATITVTDKPSPTAAPTATAAPSAAPSPTPAVSPEHEHKFDKNWKFDETKHWHECECGLKADEADHSVTEWATKDDGSQQGICTVCGAVATKAAAPTPVPAAETAKSGSNTLLIVILVIVLLVLAAVAAFLFGRMRAAKAAAPAAEEPEFNPVKDNYNPRHDGIHDEEDRAEYYRQQLENYENKK